MHERPRAPLPACLALASGSGTSTTPIPSFPSSREFINNRIKQTPQKITRFSTSANSGSLITVGIGTSPISSFRLGQLVRHLPCKHMRLDHLLGAHRYTNTHSLEFEVERSVFCLNWDQQSVAAHEDISATNLRINRGNFSCITDGRDRFRALACVFQVLFLVLGCISEVGLSIFHGRYETVRELGTSGSHLQQQGECKRNRASSSRPHSVTITEFGAVGDGVTVNTHAFQNAIFYLHSFADKGGAQLFVPAGRWLTGSFNLTSHLTLYLDTGAVILGSQGRNGFQEWINIKRKVGMEVEDSAQWPVIEPLPSYGRGRELPGGRHCSLIHGHNLTDVVITGDNGTIDGQGAVWWDWFHNHTLNYTRPHLVELMDSTDVIIANLTFLNSPFWTIHPVYCSNVRVQNVTILAPLNSPNTDGIDPGEPPERDHLHSYAAAILVEDKLHSLFFCNLTENYWFRQRSIILTSKCTEYCPLAQTNIKNESDIVGTFIFFSGYPGTVGHLRISQDLRSTALMEFPVELTNLVGLYSSSDVCIEDCYISTGDDVISIKSGWDEYGISYGRPSSNIIIRRVIGESHTSSGLALGSEMSGGIKDVHAEDLHIFNTRRGIRIKTTPGRGGYVKDIYISNVTMKSVRVGICFTAYYGDHPDDRYDPNALPVIERITLKDIVGDNITTAGSLEGIENDPFEDICMSNIFFNVTSQPAWNCSSVEGFSESVTPQPCAQLQHHIPDESPVCYSSYVSSSCKDL
eukprot:Gb_39001 [translate_table: standard]